jgi:general secretion pathway protein L
MTDYVVLRFRDCSAESVEWILVDSTGVCLGEPAHGSLTEALEAAGGHKVRALVPAVSVLRTDAAVPIRSAAKLLKALPFAMEEQLAEDVEHLHFAVANRKPDGRVPVAIVRRTVMDDWRGLFAAANVRLAGLYSESDALGDIPGTAILLIESDFATLRQSDGSVAVTDITELDALIDLWLGTTLNEEEEKTEPVNLLVYMTVDVQEAMEPFLERIQPAVDTLEVKLLSDGALPRMASQVAVNPGINLLQGDYTTGSNLAAYWPAWKVAAIVLVCLVGTIIGVKVVEIARLNQEIEALDGAIEQAFRYTFPGTGEIRDARASLNSKLRALGTDVSSADQSEFLDILASVAAAVAQSEDRNSKLEAINYRSGTMELRVLAPNVEALDTIQKALVKGGRLSAEIQSANPQGDKILGRLQVKNLGA